MFLNCSSPFLLGLRNFVKDARMASQYRTLRLILGDQLNHNHSWFQAIDEEVLYVLMETRSEATYARHHIQKIIAFFLAMRHFRDTLQAQGHRVHYIELDAEENGPEIVDNLQRLLDRHACERFEYQLPDEYRLDQSLSAFCERLSIETEVVSTEHFLAERNTVAELFKNKKTYLLETFYRHMRTQHDILMEADGETPLTGQWNYDADNRSSVPKNIEFPRFPSFEREVSDLVKLLEKAEIPTIGHVDASAFTYPVTREECLQLLDHFAQNVLHRFGDFQDAMTVHDELLFHSKLSFAMNTKLLSPLEVVRHCIDHWNTHSKAVSFNQIEGFVRQIVGWREYMRGVYWAQMPQYKDKNFFEHDADLPEWYWTGETKMNCLKHAIGQSLDQAYAHHIQRLMITGNFALLLGVHPDQVDAWYLGIYIDAIEWVEITNTRGMSQWADGGLIATKPYVSSANYVNKMSDYCKGCHYKHREKTGERACPFNSLYWDFLDRHRDRLSNNFRMAMMYRTWDKKDAEAKAALLERAAYVKEHINEL